MSGLIGERFREIERQNEWLKLYNKIRNDSSKHSKLPIKTAKASQNVRLNRYRDVLPYDHSRVVLPSGSYINASHVSVREAGREYILTQGPLPCTAEHFWEMVWFQKSKAVIMLNKIIEKSQIKCHQYFPIGRSTDGLINDEEMIFGDFKVILLKESTSNDHFAIRTLILKNEKLKEQREVLHFQFNTWPDFGVPESTTEFLEFLYEVRKKNVLDSKEYGPPIIHCSAGIGRSGTFILVDAVLILAKNKNLSEIDVINMVTELRQYRMGLIQTYDQLRFCWMAIVDALEKEEWKDLLDMAGPGPPKEALPIPTTPMNKISVDDPFSSSLNNNNNDVKNRPDLHRSSANTPTTTEDESEKEDPNISGDDLQRSKKRRKSDYGVVVKEQKVSSSDEEDEKKNGKLAFRKKNPSQQEEESLQSYMLRMQERQQKAQKMRERIENIQAKIRYTERMNKHFLYRFWSKTGYFLRNNPVYLLGVGGLTLALAFGYFYYRR